MYNNIVQCTTVLYTTRNDKLRFMMYDVHLDVYKSGDCCLRMFDLWDCPNTSRVSGIKSFTKMQK